ncbi:MAG: ParB N-terminal domain-containing protein, partial [Porticoccaceae bacterium]|nr:ParB N-terminal domain-containing protein [Porticoccaceae bacterium]
MNTIALSKINLKAPTQLRSSGEDMSHVEDLAHSFADTGSFKELPWVALIKDTNEYVPIDGFHRLTALQWLVEQEDIECQVDLDNVSVRLTEFDSMSEAIVAAAGVNSSHGLKRKSTDIQNAIQRLLEVDRIGFSKTKYTLDSEAIMKVVNCSSATYRRATEEIRRELTNARDFEVKRLDYEGISQREIQQRTGVPQKTISRILSESKRSMSKATQDECLDGLGGEKCSMSKTPQSVNTLQHLSESKRS